MVWKAIYQVEGYTIIHSGQLVPSESPLIRNEGVNIVLDPVLTAAWREAGETWKAVSLRVTEARAEAVSRISHTAEDSHSLGEDSKTRDPTAQCTCSFQLSTRQKIIFTFYHWCTIRKRKKSKFMFGALLRNMRT